MWYLLTTLWLPALIALLLGFMVGWITNTGGKSRWLTGWVPWALVAFVVGLVVAFLHLLPGRPGLWLEVGLLLFAAYIIGCFLGGLLRGGSGTIPSVAATAATASVGLASAPAPVGSQVVAERPAAGPMPKPAVAAVPPVAVARPTASPVAPAAVAVAASALPPSDLDTLPGMTSATRAKLEGLGITNRAQLAKLDLVERGWLWDRLGRTGDWQSAGWWPAGATGAGTVASLVTPQTPVAPATPVVPAKLATKPELVGGVDVSTLEGERPASLAAPRDNKADDLKRIRGIGPQNEGRLHGLGIWHFDQIAAWTLDQVRWVGGYLAFPGRIEREDWVAQAKVLASGVETAFSQRVARGEVATSRDDGTAGQGNVVTPLPGKPGPTRT